MKQLALAGLWISAHLLGATTPQLLRISVYPSQARVGGHSQQTLVVTGFYSNGVEADVTAKAKFRVRVPQICEVQPNGVAYPLRVGKTEIEAAFEGKRATAELTVADMNVNPVSFLREISPILTQKGCTGSNCHGSIRGKAGFKLSLFGGRPDLDYEAIVKADQARRINPERPEDSLILRKATFQIPHGGGVRFQPNSLEYRAIVDWIKGNMVYENGGPELQELEVYPAERIVIGAGGKQKLVVTGLYSDGSRMDLTPVVRYTSNDEGIAAVNDAGEVTTKKTGETSIMVRTLGKAAVMKIAVIESAPGRDYPSIPASNFIDEIVFAKLRRLNIVPSELSNDSEFIRRVYLDTTGVLPSIQETKQFLASQDPLKRGQLIDALLARPEFVDLWGIKMADLHQLGGAGVKGGWQLYRWFRRALAANRPYDEMVRALLLSGGPFVYEDTPNFYAGLWVGPEGMVTQVSQGLLGIRMDCAKCHDHPFERWTQDDFYGLAAFFTRLEFKAESYGLFERSIAVRPDTKPTYDYVSTGKELMHPKTKAGLQPRFLGGETVHARPDEDIRERLADWVTSPQNPWFSRAIANRIWKHYLGRGIVEPVDDFRVTNPPSNGALLNALADYLTREKYDLRKLMRVILNSRTYQLSSAPNQTNQKDEWNYSRFYLKRQIAETLLDAMSTAAEAKVKIAGYPPGTKAIRVAIGAPNYFLMTFGKLQARDQICERDQEPNVSQAMHLVNGDTLNDLIQAKGNIVDRVLGQSAWPDDQRIEEMYLIALSRCPTAEEASGFKAQLAGVSDDPGRKKLYQDLLWAILNSKEFAYIY